eukprot:m.839736 g.839736  ORF g.839736 m.839736 type:complete len:157 (-) comp59505_c0_seq43:78-548(-)
MSLSLPAVECFLAHGADVYLQNKEGKTALELAQAYGELETAKILQAHEEHLANLGAKTKPALRTPAAESNEPPLPSTAESSVPALVNLLDLPEASQEPGQTEVAPAGDMPIAPLEHSASAPPDHSTVVAPGAPAVPALGLDLTDLQAELDALTASE